MSSNNSIRLSFSIFIATYRMYSAPEVMDEGATDNRFAKQGVDGKLAVYRTVQNPFMVAYYNCERFIASRDAVVAILHCYYNRVRRFEPEGGRAERYTISSSEAQHVGFNQTLGMCIFV